MQRSEDNRRDHYRTWDRRRSRDKRILESLFRDWYGEGAASLEIEFRQSREQPIRAIVDDIVDDIERDECLMMRRLLEKWDSLMTAPICYNAIPRNIRKGVLYVEVMNSAWMFHLKRNFKSEMLTLVRKFSNGNIRDIRFVPGGKTRFSR